MVYGTYNELVTGANQNQLITGGPHIVGTKLGQVEFGKIIELLRIFQQAMFDAAYIGTSPTDVGSVPILSD